MISPEWDNGAATDAGAVTFGNGTTGISGVVSESNSLVGTTADDRIGNSVTLLDNGNYVVNSSDWDNGAVANAGAVTFADGSTGVVGPVTPANSLVGSSTDDFVGGNVVALVNGNYVVQSPDWDNGAISNVGAVTFGSGTAGITGAVSDTNSLVGSTAGDVVGNNSVVALSNGSYVVESSDWDNGAIVNAGAATFGDGTTGISGPVSAVNSLVGSSAQDSVFRTTALGNGNYVVISSSWDNGAITNAGAVTFGDGTIGVTGEVSATNSLVGVAPFDLVGDRLTVLPNGNYIVQSGLWDNAGIENAGAVTFADGTAGIVGPVTSDNSLVGSSAFESIGDEVVGLTNGNYVVASGSWDGGRGAVTFANGSTGITGPVTESNSLVGATTDDRVGSRLTALSNGNYVVSSHQWDNGAATDAGAVTLGNGTTGTTGIVSASNSLVGSSTNDLVGQSVTALTNGNFVVQSPFWNNGAATEAGAVTFGDGTSGVTGVVSASNSLVGSSTDDHVGSVFTGGVTALAGGNYVVPSPDWDNGGVTNAGAATFGDGTTGVTGTISQSNSLIGSFANDFVGAGIVTLENGNYVVENRLWNSRTGAITFGSGATGVSGTINTDNSAIGSTNDTNPSKRDCR